MSFVNQSAEINTAQIVAAHSTQGNDDATRLFLSQIGGATVKEYDEEIQDHTIELQALNEQKQAVRTDKNQITVLLSQMDVVDGQGFTFTDDSGVSQSMTGNATIITSSDKTELETLAAALGIQLNIGFSSTSSSYAIDESSLKSLSDALDGKMSDLNSTSELKMIQFQSLMDARKQAMMILSNLLSADHQTKMAVIQNMKN